MDRLPGIRKRLNPWQRIDAAGRVAFPAVCTMLAILVLAAPLGLPGQPALRGSLALASIFFWSLHRPDSMTPLTGFLLGLLVDLVGSGPIGISIVALLVGQGIAQRWRRVLARQEFLVVWIAFCGVALLFAAVVWTLDSLFAFTLLPLDPVLFQAAFAAGCYPLLSLALLAADRGIADPEQA